VLLLPAFFALTGLHTEIGLLGDAQAWLICGRDRGWWRRSGNGAARSPAARFQRPCVAVGRGARGDDEHPAALMALIVLDIGLNMGVISPTLFAMMVLMALATTPGDGSGIAAAHAGGKFSRDAESCGAERGA